MSRGPRNPEVTDSDWRPAASLETLRLRAELLAEIRRFFADRGVLARLRFGVVAEALGQALDLVAVAHPHDRAALDAGEEAFNVTRMNGES